jgi:hypothetical protein
MKFIFFLFTIITCSSCEVYQRYFMMSSNRYGAAKITVKVKSMYDLPKQFIPAYKSSVGCNANTNTDKENNFHTKIKITLEPNKLQYTFILQPCYTVWLQPSKIGIPVLEYIIIDDRDTVAISDASIKTNSLFAFKSLLPQKYLLTIK